MTAPSGEAEPTLPLPPENESGCRPEIAVHGGLTGKLPARADAGREHCGLHERLNCYTCAAVDEAERKRRNCQ